MGEDKAIATLTFPASPLHLVSQKDLLTQLRKNTEVVCIITKPTKIQTSPS